MNLTTRAAAFLAVAAAALCLSSGAFAQNQGAQDQAAPAAPGAGMHHGADRAEWKKDREARMAARQERRAQRLHDILNIRSDQEPAFHAFLADIKPQQRDHKDWAGHKDGAQAAAPQTTPMTTPERLDRVAAMMAKRTSERQARFQQRADAVKRFYAVLGPEQKRAFDALHAMRGGMHGGGRGGMHHEGGQGGHGDWGGHEHGEDSAAG